MTTFEGKMRQLFSGILLSACGALLFLFRMPLVYQLVGRFKTRVALLLGVDKLQLLLDVLWMATMSLLFGGIVLIFVGLRRRGAKLPRRSNSIQ